MMTFIDNQLNKITTYRLVLYALISLLAVGFVLSLNGQLPYNAWSLLLSVGFLVAVSWIANGGFSATFGVPANVESVYITALILALIITPIHAAGDLWFLFWAAVLAMASKYIVAYKGKHLFNPAAFAVAVTYLAVNQSASWWVGSAPMLPFVAIAGLLIVRKLERFELVLTFLLTAVGVTWVASLVSGTDLFATTQKMLQSSPLIFFASIILTEPMTTPPTRRSRFVYGALVGVLFVPQLSIGGLFITPELAILAGNLYSFIVSPKARLALRIKERTRIAPDTYEFVFAAPQGFRFKPGQFMEWTLRHPRTDSRGNRRYFTLASSPTEHNIRLAVKVNPHSSSFKKAMLAANRDTVLVASQLAGDFVLPDDTSQACIFIAGGIGVTPFRSMIKHMLDRGQKRPVTLFYAAKNVNEFVYRDVFDRAQKELGIRTVYTVTDSNTVPTNWNGKVGRITPEVIRQAVPNFRDCVFYVSGPRGMVDGFKRAIGSLGVPGLDVRTDYFAGLA